MKNLFFAAGIIVCTLLSCSSSKNLNNPATTLKTSQNFFGSSNAISEAEAIAMIKRFPRHKTHFRREKYLANAWAGFDLQDLKTINNKMKNVAGIKFYFAGQIIKNKDTARYPTLVMQIMLKDVDKNLFNSVQYIRAAQYCPPPSGCVLITNE